MVRVWVRPARNEGRGATPGQAGQGPRLEWGASPNRLKASEATHG